MFKNVWFYVAVVAVAVVTYGFATNWTFKKA